MSVLTQPSRMPLRDRVSRHMPFPLRYRHETAFQWVQMVAPVLGSIAAGLFTFYYGMPLGTLAVAGVFGILTGLGVTVGFHRLFTHRSFETHPAVRAALAIFGSMAAQGTLYSWVAGHRQHHQFSDHHGDPHSPNRSGSSFWGRVLAIWNAHVGWMLDVHMTPERMGYIPDLIADPLLARVQRLHLVWVTIGFALPAALCWVISGTWQGAVAGLLWGGFVRIALTDHISFGLNSVCHLWGKRPFQAHDLSRNNGVMAVLAFGEGWHNNHHAFPTSARHGLRWWEVDMSYNLIQLLQLCGLAWNVKTPTAAQIESKARTKSDVDDASA